MFCLKTTLFVNIVIKYYSIVEYNNINTKNFNIVESTFILYNSTISLNLATTISIDRLYIWILILTRVKTTYSWYIANYSIFF